MISDDERREVAERLRGLNGNVSHVRRVYEAEGLSIFCEDQADYYQICDTVTGYLPAEHMHPCDYDEFHARLADLIDPTCLACPDVEDTPDGGQFECWSCSVCGNIVSVDPDYDTDADGPTYCEVCGHRIVGKGEPTWL